MKKTLCTLALVLALSLAFTSVAFAATDDADLDEAAVVTEAADDAAVVDETPAPVVSGNTITDAYTPADNVVTLTFASNIDGKLTADDITIVDANGDARNVDKIMFPAGGNKAVVVIRKIFDKGVTFTVTYNGMGTDFVR